MTHLEMIERFQATFGTSYTVAKEYLEESEWDILEALILYERRQNQNKNDEPVAPVNDTSKDEHKQYEHKQYEEREDRSQYEHAERREQGFGAWLKRNYTKAKLHRLIISKDGREISSMKLSTAFWIIVISAVTFFSVPVMLLAFVVSLFFGVNYKIEGPGEVRQVNYTLDKMTNWVDDNFKAKDKSDRE